MRATSARSASAGFTRPLPSAIVMPGHGIGLGFLVRRPDRLLVGSAGAGAGWSGVGIVLIFRISLIGWFILRQVLDLAAMPGMARVICRVPVILPFSRSTVH